MQRNKIFKKHLAFRFLRSLQINGLKFQQRKIAFRVLRGTDKACYRITRAQPKASDLAWRHINIVRAGQIRTNGRSQEAKTILQYFDHALTSDFLPSLGVRFKNREYLVLAT